MDNLYRARAPHRAVLTTDGYIRGVTLDRDKTGMVFETAATGIVAVTGRRLFVRLSWYAIARVLRAVPLSEIPPEAREAHEKVITLYEEKGRGWA